MKQDEIMTVIRNASVCMAREEKQSNIVSVFKISNRKFNKINLKNTKTKTFPENKKADIRIYWYSHAYASAEV